MGETGVLTAMAEIRPLLNLLMAAFLSGLILGAMARALGWRAPLAVVIGACGFLAGLIWTAILTLALYNYLGGIPVAAVAWRGLLCTVAGGLASCLTQLGRPAESVEKTS